MRVLVDTGMLLCGCLLLALIVGQAGTATVIWLIAAVTIAGLSMSTDQRQWGIAAPAAYLLVGALLTDSVTGAPLVVYVLARLGALTTRRARMAAVAACIPFVAVIAARVRDTPVLALALVLCALAALLALRTVQEEAARRSLHAVRDDLREKVLTLQDTNAQLLQAQDYELRAAALAERTRIAREIHDGVGHLLTRLLLQVKALQIVHREEPDVVADLTTLDGGLDEALDSMRRSVHALSDEGEELATSLNLLGLRCGIATVSVDCSTDTEPPAADTVVNYESAAGSLMDVRTGSYLAQVHDYLGALNDDPAQAVSLADGAMERTASAQLVPQDSAPMPKRLMTFATFSLYPLLTFSVVSISTLMTALDRRPVRSRMSAAPVSGRARGLGLLGACLIIGLVGWAWIFGLGVHFFGKEYLATSAPMVGVLGTALGAYTLVSVSLGFLLGQLGLGDNATNAIANIGGMVMSVLGGAWISVDMLPDAVVAFSRFTPGYWAARAITGLHNAASISSDTILPLLADCGVCTLFAVALLSVGIAVGRTRARSAL